MSSKVLYEYLQSVGCCETCVLRYFKAHVDEFLDIPKAFLSRNIVIESAVESTEDDNAVKKRKINSCVACFGLFGFIQEIADKIRSSSELQEYEMNKFLCAFSLPVLLHLSQLQMWLDLIEKFPQTSKEIQPDTSIKDVLKTILSAKLQEELSMEFHLDGLMININFSIANEVELMNKLEVVAPELYAERNKQKKRYRTEVISRNYFEKFFVPTNINLEKFRKTIPVPPTEPIHSMHLDKVTFTGPTVFLAGRYNKFTRDLSQTPWILGGKRLMEDSVQEIMVRQIASYFKVKEDSITFMSSGREDVDVRCLGDGRPFVLEIPNSAKVSLDEESAINMERNVNKSGKVSIRDLQLVKREELYHIKSGEEDKKKIYRALCIVQEDVGVEILKLLNIENGFLIQQWTPLRVLHRRSLIQRPRMIHSIVPHLIEGSKNQIALDIITQAGTYIKELVHGEFGRTEPSISSIIGKEIDIVALDVMNIDLNFPPSLNRIHNID